MLVIRTNVLMGRVFLNSNNVLSHLIALCIKELPNISSKRILFQVNVPLFTEKRNNKTRNHEQMNSVPPSEKRAGLFFLCEKHNSK